MTADSGGERGADSGADGGVESRAGGGADAAGWLDQVAFDAAGLVPVIAQQASDRRVLMVAWADRAALAETAEGGYAVYFSRSRGRLWRKGEESGHRQRVAEIRLDCDGDVVLYLVDQEGGIACHTGRASCFFRRLEDGVWREVDPVLKDPEAIYARSRAPGTRAAPGTAQAGNDGKPMSDDVLIRLADVIEARRGADPERSYVARLLAKGPDAVLKKIGEEATETVMAAKDAEPGRIVAETADLWFHCLVMLSHYRIRPEQVLAELQRRAGTSGLEEKALRKAVERERGTDER